MPLPSEFTRHLHDVMVEVAEALSDSEAKYKLELIGKARATHNGGAMPIAYKDAELHRLQTRFEMTVDRYFQALVEWGIPIDDSVEREMRTHIDMLTAGSHQLHFPPGLRLTKLEAIHGAYARERQRLAHRLQLAAKNRLRDIKMKGLLRSQDEREAAQRQRALQPSVVNHTHYTATGQNARVNVNSTDNSTNVVSVNALELLEKIIELSREHSSPEMQKAAEEAKAAYPDKKLTATKIAAWVSLASGAGHLMHQAMPYLTEIYKWLAN
jgi:hypothetical protein